MKEVWQIIYGAGFTVAFCWASGWLLLNWLGVRLLRGERQLLAFVSGSAVVSALTFVLCLVHEARRSVFLTLGAVAIAFALRSLKLCWEEKALPGAPRFWRVLFAVVWLVFMGRYFWTALAPEISADGAAYHLGNVNRMCQANGFVWTHHNMYSYLSQGVEMLFLVAFSLGRHSAAALTHLAFLAVLPLLMMALGRRTGHPAAGCFAGLIVVVSPVIGLDGASAYNDIGLAAVVLTAVYFLQVWDESRNNNLLILSGMLCGFAYGIKYTSATLALVAISWVMVRLRRDRPALLHAMFALCAPAAAFALPWALRNWIWLGNPFAPFFNHWFPNPWYHSGMERIYAEGLRHYEGLQHWWQVPYELTLHGDAAVTGILGPIFLLAPIALLALRWPLGRRMLLIALVLALPARYNIGTRFLIPAVPFVAFAMGLALEQWRGALAGLAVFHAFFCQSSMVPLYAHKYTWRLSAEAPVAAALRRMPPPEYMIKFMGDYPLFRRIELFVPPKGRVFSCSGRPEAYINREILVSYESAEANLLYDVLNAPIDGYRPNRRLTFRIPQQPLTGVRVVQTAKAISFWTVAEMRVFAGGRELPREPGWRLRAQPNGWDVQLAFDNSSVTRWSSWEGTRPGQFLAVEFGGTRPVDRIEVERTGEGHSKLALEGRGTDGTWRPLAAQMEEVEVAPPTGMRRDAMAEFKAHGVRHLLLSKTDGAWQDIQKYPEFWGLHQLGEAGGSYLYEIE